MEGRFETYKTLPELLDAVRCRDEGLPIRNGYIPGVFDASEVRWMRWSTTRPIFAKKEGRVRTAGKQFRPESYGIAFPVGSTLRRSVDQALLKVMENGTYDTLVREWLGDVNSSDSKD